MPNAQQNHQDLEERRQRPGEQEDHHGNGRPGKEAPAKQAPQQQAPQQQAPGKPTGTGKAHLGENPGGAPENPGNVPSQQQHKTSSGGKARGE